MAAYGLRVSKNWTPKRPTVALDGSEQPRVSRIRRDPPGEVPKPKALKAYPTEREVRTVIVGVILFGIAIMIITLGLSDITSR
ncbi:hypothetical protein G7078_10560 [Sphingomonas sinipercae]|uniref:Uncharacterized protein n=1 Tax=Sphingomonas sinipercae TaxID=2714944 RepID=A0A6G7ZQB3_9SPHN|nr:hypothetical protein [Sphingomonas sinipercae]QIL03174.1 hypothetical protein G7078_10560 [Sphingomonas sinipercae]